MEWPLYRLKNQVDPYQNFSGDLSLIWLRRVTRPCVFDHTAVSLQNGSVLLIFPRRTPVRWLAHARVNGGEQSPISFRNCARPCP